MVFNIKGNNFLNIKHKKTTFLCAILSLLLYVSRRITVVNKDKLINIPEYQMVFIIGSSLNK